MNFNKKVYLISLILKPLNILGQPGQYYEQVWQHLITKIIEKCLVILEYKMVKNYK